MCKDIYWSIVHTGGRIIKERRKEKRKGDERYEERDRKKERRKETKPWENMDICQYENV